MSNWLKHFKEIYTVNFLPRQNLTFALDKLNFQFLLLHKYIPKGLYVLAGSVVSTGVGVVVLSASTKPNPGVTWSTVVLIVTKNADSCFGVVWPGALGVEPFLVTIVIEGGARGNQWKPRVTTQWSRTVLSVSDQWMQGTGALNDFNEIDLVVDLHTKANFGEGCVPVGGKFCLLWVKPSPPSINVKSAFVLPKRRSVVERLL